MIKFENAPKKLSFVKERIAELSNVESRLTASGDIDVKCTNIQTASGDASTVAAEIFL
jgi:hypothetical protein